MKNIHVLPTTPNNETAGGVWIKETRDWCNIYITNSEKIKEGDYVITPTNDIIQWAKVFQPIGKKIILTTDQDLIKDGVQEIDDEFLEWFVKNPSCEKVEVGYGFIRLTETDNEGYWVSIPDKQFEMQQEEPKQEIVGYRLKPSIDRKIIDVILKNSMPIWNQEDKSVYFIRGHIAGSLVAKMKELQVLDLWFTPIYEFEEVKSDWLKQNHLDYYYKEGIMNNEPKQEPTEEAKQRAKNYMSLKGALEPKQIKCYCGHTTYCDCSPLEEPKDVVLGYKTSLDAQMLDKIGLEEPKQEIWKDIPNYEGLYQVSNFGNVKSLERYVKGKVEDRLQKENILSKRLVGDIGNQYYAVTLCNNKNRKQIKISVLVAMAFLNHIPNGYVGFTVDHIDNNPLNNNVNNLQVITKRENSSKDRKGISKYTGVTFNKKTNKWRSQIWINGQNKTLGSFDDELEAHRAYQKELQQHLKLQ